MQLTVEFAGWKPLAQCRKTTRLLSAMAQSIAQLAQSCNDLFISSAFEHYDTLHSNPQGTVLLWAKNQEKGRWSKLKPMHASVSALLAEQQGGTDRYISVSEFHSWRVVAQLKSLRACYADIDGCTDVEWILQCVQSAGLPTPTFIILSGRGVHLYWQIDAVPSQALGLWQQVQDKLISALIEQGVPVDPVARDCTRVLRLAGSINSKNGAVVHGRLLVDWTWDLHSLADEVLGARACKTKKIDPDIAVKGLELDKKRDAQIRDFRAAQVRRGIAPGTAPKGAQRGGIYAWWQLVYQDLIKIGDQLGGIPRGHRDTYLFLYAAALGWFATGEAIEHEITLVAKKLMPELSAERVKKAVQPNLKRLQDALSGKKIEYKGVERDPRYWHKRETLYNLLQEIIPDYLYDDLRAIVPACVIKSRRDARAAVRYSDKNTGDGVRLGNLAKKTAAIEMAKNGSKQKVIAEALAVSQGTVSNWLKNEKY